MNSVYKKLFVMSLIFIVLNILSMESDARTGFRGTGVIHPAHQHRVQSARNYQAQFRQIPQGPVPVLYNDYFSPNFGPLYEYDEPCHYNEEYGVWEGPCNVDLNQPGYSITVPNRVR